MIVSKISNSKQRRKRKLLRVLWFNLFFACIVPSPLSAAFDAPDPYPIAFSLANLVTFPDYLVPDTENSGGWHFSTGLARLFAMPEIQPFAVRTGGPGLGGRWRLSGKGLASGAYTEAHSGLAFKRRVARTLQVELEVCLLQLAIEDYGSAWSGLVNARAWWQLQPGVELAAAWLNVNNAHLGSGNYPLPRRFALGGFFQLIPRTDLFLELEKDTRYSLQSRFGIGYQLLSPLILLFGFQSDPDILSTGLSCLIGSIRATAAFQYHPDLGISQCYGLVLGF